METPTRLPAGTSTVLMKMYTKGFGCGSYGLSSQWKPEGVKGDSFSGNRSCSMLLATPF